MNGWQRLWFAGTILSLIAFALIYPVIEQGKLRNFSYRWAVEKDYRNPACSHFVDQPFERLQEPPYGDGGTCWHIYTSRRYADSHEGFKDYAAWVSNDDRTYWLNVLAFCGIMALVVLFFSALVYGFGKTIGWIVTGFKQPRV
ncbi:hypothetical protein [Rhizobium leguminosarum]|uniref:hypothetical protein n=1 Tax=Rhizobium leguminosarum TaxID=384 RepID=UPI0013E91E17|nr:hypothetical protein [Rhizobium leguminosarum]